VIGERGKENTVNVGVVRNKSQVKSFYMDEIRLSASQPLSIPALVTRRARL
jgi:hypothetical protein